MCMFSVVYISFLKKTSANFSPILLQLQRKPTVLTENVVDYAGNSANITYCKCVLFNTFHYPHGRFVEVFLFQLDKGLTKLPVPLENAVLSENKFNGLTLVRKLILRIS